MIPNELWLLIESDKNNDLLEQIPDDVLIKIAADFLDNLISDHDVPGATWRQVLDIIEWSHCRSLTNSQRFWLYMTFREHANQRDLFRNQL